MTFAYSVLLKTCFKNAVKTVLKLSLSSTVKTGRDEKCSFLNVHSQLGLTARQLQPMSTVIVVEVVVLVAVVVNPALK